MPVGTLLWVVLAAIAASIALSYKLKVNLGSWPHPDDLDDLLSDIRKLRPQVDILMVSFHWGIHFVPKVLAQYQKYTAHFAIDEGADIILGHHTHILKPIEVYKGKPII